MWSKYTHNPTPIRRIDDWSLEASGDPYMAPELARRRVRGVVEQQILTSEIVSSDGTLITTSSGSVYELGKPDPNYVKWLRSQGMRFDPKNPIKMPRKKRRRR